MMTVEDKCNRFMLYTGRAYLSLQGLYILLCLLIFKNVDCRFISYTSKGNKHISFNCGPPKWFK